MKKNYKSQVNVTNLHHEFPCNWFAQPTAAPNIISQVSAGAELHNKIHTSISLQERPEHKLVQEAEIAQ